MHPEVDQFLENAFAEIGLIHPLQITPADVRVQTQHLYAPVFFGVLLHFLAQRHKCFKKLRIFDSFLTVSISLSGQRQMFECKAKTVQKCAVFSLITARQLSEGQRHKPELLFIHVQRREIVCSRVLCFLCQISNDLRLFHRTTGDTAALAGTVTPQHLTAVLAGRNRTVIPCCPKIICRQKDTELIPMADQIGTLRYDSKYIMERFRMHHLKHQLALVKPFLMVDRSGKTVYCIAKLKSKTKAHKANMSHDFALLKQLYEGHKKQEKLNSWIAKKQKETYVRIDENWKNCDFEHDGWIK